MPAPTHFPVRRVAAGTLATCVGVSAVLVASAAPATAARAPRAQSVGRFLDGAAGGRAVESIADLHDARATNPGTVSDQNPLAVTLGGQATIPLTGALQLPGSGNTLHVGAANQVAKAFSDGYSYGAAGAVANSGGASVGGHNNAYPADASVSLSPDAVPNPGTIPLPGAGSASALGGISAHIGAVSALAHTPAGVGKRGDTQYSIGSVSLTLGSPALGGVLKKVASALVPPTLPATPLPGFTLPKSCSFKQQTLSTLSLDGGAVVVDPTNGALSVDLVALLNELGVDINSLPANTDLLAYLTKYLADPSGLAKGLQDALHGVLDPLQANFAACMADLTKALPSQLSGPLQKLVTALQGGQQQVEDALNQIADALGSAGGKNPLAPIADGLKQALQLGVNVQPNGPRGSYTSPLRATPDQATPVVAGQTVVRAIEIDLGGGRISLALANAAAGPSTASPTTEPTSTTATPTPTAPAARHHSALPTAIPAGQGTPAGTPQLPLVLLALAIVMGGAGTVAWRMRSARH